MTSFLLFCTQNPFRKGVYPKRKEFAPKGSKFFPFRKDPFLEGSQTILTKVASLESVFFPINDSVCELHYNQAVHHHSAGLLYFLWDH